MNYRRNATRDDEKRERSSSFASSGSETKAVQSTSVVRKNIVVRSHGLEKAMINCDEQVQHACEERKTFQYTQQL